MSGPKITLAKGSDEGFSLTSLTYIGPSSPKLSTGIIGEGNTTVTLPVSLSTRKPSEEDRHIHSVGPCTPLLL